MPVPKIQHSVITLPLDLIDVDPKQPRRRFRFDKLAELTQSITENGMVQLPGIKHHPDQAGRYQIIFGENRFRSMRKAGFVEHQFMLLEGDLSSSFDLQVAENRHRQDLDAIEEAEVARRYLDEGRTLEEICLKMGYSELTVRRRLELLDLHPDVQQMVIDGTLPPLKALRLRTTPLDDQIARANRLLHGTDLALDEEQVRQERKSRKVRSSVGSPTEDMLSRLMKFGWHANAEIINMAALLKLGAHDFDTVLAKISSSARETLIRRLRDLSGTSLAMVNQLIESQVRIVARKDARGEAPVLPPKAEPVQASPTVKKDPVPEPVASPVVAPVRSQASTVLAAAAVASQPVLDPPVRPRPAPIPMARPQSAPAAQARQATAPALPVRSHTPASASRPVSVMRRRTEWIEPLPPPRVVERPALLSLTPAAIFDGRRLLDFICRSIQSQSDRHMLLSKAKLCDVLGRAYDVGQVERPALAGLRALRDVWRSPPTGEHAEFIRYVSRRRMEIDNCTSASLFAELVESLRRWNRASDPIDLTKL